MNELATLETQLRPLVSHLEMLLMAGLLVILLSKALFDPDPWFWISLFGSVWFLFFKEIKQEMSRGEQRFNHAGNSAKASGA